MDDSQTTRQAVAAVTSGRNRTLLALARQRRVARLVASGMGVKEIARQLAIPQRLVGQLVKDPELQARVEELIASNDRYVKDGLLDGERSAINFLVNLIEDDTAEPDHRLKAALSMLDRAGGRGKPVERVETQRLDLTGDAAQAALANALRDPGVRSWLEANPKVAGVLMAPPNHTPPAPGKAIAVPDEPIAVPDDDPESV